MIYESAIDQVKGLKGESAVMFRLAEVTSLSNGRAYVQFYGESAASTKLYPYIEGYKPTVGDKVLMIAQGETFIIAGKISKDNITDNYYLTKGTADSTYLTEAAADERYEPKGSSDYPTQLRNNKYWFGFNSSNDGELLSYALSGSPSPSRASLGNSANPFTLYTDGIDIRSGNIIPYQQETSDIGSTSKRMRAGYFKQLGDASLSYSIQTLNVRNTKYYGDGAPDQNDAVDLGSSGKRFKNVYAKQFYQNGTAISTSDKRKKTGIKAITKKYISFFRNLRPALFKFKDGDSGRTHCGFIAQEVEAAANEAGIDNKELAFLCIDNEGNYGLRYEELIALQTQIIQDLLIRVENLEEGSKK